MYVCLCQGVKESDVRRAIAGGVGNVEQLGERLGVGTGCGCCREYAQTLLEEQDAGELPAAAPAG